MNWWGGSKKDSETQAGERSQRAARRKIADLQLNPLSDEEEIYEDCDLSINNTSIFNVDGADDAADEDDAMAAALTAAQLAAEKLKAFQDSSFPDDEDAWKKEVRIKFDKNDVEYWFNAIENQMKKFGINSQWSKKRCHCHNTSRRSSGGV